MHWFACFGGSPSHLIIWSALWLKSDLSIVDQSMPVSILAKSILGSWIWSVFRSVGVPHWDPQMRDSWTLQCQRYQFSQFHWQYPSMRRGKAKTRDESGMENVVLNHCNHRTKLYHNFEPPIWSFAWLCPKLGRSSLDFWPIPMDGEWVDCDGVAKSHLRVDKVIHCQ